MSAFADRSLADQAFRYVFLVATYSKARVNHRVVSLPSPMAVPVAIGMRADGWREVLRFAAGERGRRVLDRVPAHPEGPRPDRGAARGLRRPHRPALREADQDLLVGIFANPHALLRLAGAVLTEAHDEWQMGDRRYLAEASMATVTTPAPRQHTEVANGEHPAWSTTAEPQADNDLHHSAGRDPTSRLCPATCTASRSLASPAADIEPWQTVWQRAIGSAWHLTLYDAHTLICRRGAVLTPVMLWLS